MLYNVPPGQPPQQGNPFNDSTHALTSNTTSVPGLQENDIPSDPPPAYTPSANMANGESTLQAGPSSMISMGSPHMPGWTASQQNGIVENVTEVRIGYGHGGEDGGNGPPLPSRRPLTFGQELQASQPPLPLSQASSFQSQDLSPTEHPTPGRPLLHRGHLLVYPKDFWCPKCGNTGYKANDPSNPHEVDWRTYGRPYNSVLAHSYITIISNRSHGVNPSAHASVNFQRPLPCYPSVGSTSPMMPTATGSNPYAQLPPPPAGAKWNLHPGQYRGSSFSHLPPPPRPPMPTQGQQIYVQHSPGPVPPGALEVRPGDPRIGGRLCWRCSGSGRESSFFGFNDGRCQECRGLGRLF
ncbi:uncharacterized protein L203_101084 [Cryptococcus depauperatus CBS 7841]|uniref:Uncharacterized protein n=1 Tax=Cryptococcus depauperatus CBS 7841 TaxID=1295531 RepID=A0A1E3IKB0_9TREE|nr:hypothetical protein L203_02454 [Cryptococcus depauperatus CBS 7841]